MEKRRLIGIVLLVLAGIVCLTTTVLSLTKLSAAGLTPDPFQKGIHTPDPFLKGRLAPVIIYLVVVLAFLLPDVWAFARPDARPPLARGPQAAGRRIIDAAGYRYITLGTAALTITIVLTINLLSKLGWDPFASMTSTVAIVVFGIVATITMFWAEGKNQKNNAD